MPLNAFAAIPLLASLVLAYRADERTVYVAADSRLTSLNRDLTAPPDDHACKIRVLHDGIVFVGTGNTLFTVNLVRTNIYALAAGAARELPERPLQPDDVRRVALAWQTVIHARLAAKLRSVPAAGAPPTLGTTGSFYAATADGNVYSITLRVAVDADGVLRNIEEPASLAGYLVATGTAEAKRNALALATAPSAASLPWPRRLQAIEAETIRQEAGRSGHNSDIGGPIDLIAITPAGPRWLARKPGCR